MSQKLKSIPHLNFDCIGPEQEWRKCKRLCFVFSDITLCNASLNVKDYFKLFT